MTNKQEIADEELREKSLEWFFKKNKDEKIDLKNKYFTSTSIPYSNQWGFHFTFGQIEEMFTKELDNQ